MRFYRESGHLIGTVLVTTRDRTDASPRQRAWILFIYENRALIPWVVVGLLALLAAFILGLWLPAPFSPDTVLPFLVRPDLPPALRPGY
jgi:hypothetical protein